MSIEDKYALTIGKLVVQSTQLMQHAEDADAVLMRSYELLAQCVRSEQCLAEQIELIMQDPVFAKWYKQKYP